MNMFLTPPTFEKSADVSMDEDPSRWPVAVLTELNRIVPEAIQYSPEFTLIQYDPELGTGLGIVKLRGGPDTALKTLETSSARDVPEVRVPVIFSDYKLKPLDVLVTSSGVFMPMTAERLSQALFRPNQFSLVASEREMGNLASMLYPVSRTETVYGNGMMSGGTGMSGMPSGGGKFSMLATLEGTFRAEDLKAVGSKIANDGYLYHMIKVNPAFAGAVTKLAAAQGPSGKQASRDYSALPAAVMPTALQFGHDPEHGYWVKKANHEALGSCARQYCTRAALTKLAGAEAVAAVDKQSTPVTIGINPTATLSGMTVAKHRDGNHSLIESSGTFEIFDAKGKPHVGSVFVGLVSVDGTRVPMSLFTNGAVSVVQDQFFGRRVGHGLPAATNPVGSGVFFLENGPSPLVTVPMRIKSRVNNPDGTDSFYCTTVLGEDVEVRRMAGVNGYVSTISGSTRTLHVPADTQFYRVDGGAPEAPLASAPTTLSDGRGGYLKVADAFSDIEAGASQDSVTVRAANGEVLFDWGGLTKAAAHFGERLSLEDGLFALAAVGVRSGDLVKAASSLADGKSLTWSGARDITPFSRLTKEASEVLKTKWAAISPLRADLLKEAAALNDARSVDAILSLGFLNTENAERFVAHLPELESTLSHLCEMLIAARLGLKELNEGALLRAIRGMDASISGLRAVAASMGQYES